MIEMTVEINADRILQSLAEIHRELASMQTPLKQAGIYMLRSIDKNFQQEGRPNRWEPLSEFTVMKRRRGRGKMSAKILQDTGRLKQSITSTSAVSLKGKDTLAIGTSVPYARIHQQGGTQKAFGNGKSVRIPKRPFLLFQNEDKVAINKIFNTYIKNTILRFGR